MFIKVKQTLTMLQLLCESHECLFEAKIQILRAYDDDNLNFVKNYAAATETSNPSVFLSHTIIFFFSSYQER